VCTFNLSLSVKRDFHVEDILIRIKVSGKTLSQFVKSVIFLNFHPSKCIYDEGIMGWVLFFTIVGSCIKTCFLLRPLLVSVRWQKIFRDASVEVKKWIYTSEIHVYQNVTGFFHCDRGFPLTLKINRDLGTIKLRPRLWWWSVLSFQVLRIGISPILGYRRSKWS
jgi:hypothetical protein